MKTILERRQKKKQKMITLMVTIIKKLKVSQKHLWVSQKYLRVSQKYLRMSQKYLRMS